MHAKGLDDCARQLLLELDELRSLDAALPTKAAGEVRLRVVARHEKPLAEPLANPGMDLPRLPKQNENVIPKIGPQETQVTDLQDQLFPD